MTPREAAWDALYEALDNDKTGNAHAFVLGYVSRRVPVTVVIAATAALQQWKAERGLDR